MPPDSEGDWHQLHPLSPLLHSGRLLLPAVVVGVQLRGDAIPGEFIAPIVIGVILIGAVIGYLSWRFTRYRVEANLFELRSGVLFRKHRRMPLARLESVDIRAGLLSRIFGLAELHLEAVSSGDSEIRLSFLPEPQAAALRATLLARRAGVAPDAPPPPEIVLAVVPTRALVITALLPIGAALGVFVLTMAVVFAVAPGADTAVVLFGGIPAAAIAMLPLLFNQESLYNFTLAEAPDGLRIRRGLLNLRTQTIPIERVQAVRIIEPLLWRPFGWVRLQVDVAGYRGGQAQARAQSSILMPVAPRKLVGMLTARVLPGLDLSGLTLEPAPLVARWRAPIRYRSFRIAWTDQHAVARRGLLRPLTDCVPHRKIQSFRMTAGPWQRRLGLATVHLDTPGSAVHAQAVHRTEHQALQLIEHSRQSR